jgi:hypothetical protein
MFCVVASCCVAARGQKLKANLPTDDEIKAVVDRAERVMQLYKRMSAIHAKILGEPEGSLRLGEKVTRAISDDKRTILAVEADTVYY